LSEGRRLSKQLSDETAEWSLQQSGKSRPQEMEKITWGIKLIYPFVEEEVQPRRLHKESQPLEQLDEVIEE
jgi:hypothetical protein